MSTDHLFSCFRTRKRDVELLWHPATCCFIEFLGRECNAVCTFHSLVGVYWEYSSWDQHMHSCIPQVCLLPQQPVSSCLLRCLCCSHPFARVILFLDVDLPRVHLHSQKLNTYTDSSGETTERLTFSKIHKFRSLQLHNTPTHVI